MNKKEQQQFDKLANQLDQEMQLCKKLTQCCDMLADALIQGGIDRSFEALTFHELLTNGIQYPGVKLSQPKPKRAPRRRNPNHPTMGYYIAGKDADFKFDFKPYDQDEEQED